MINLDTQLQVQYKQEAKHVKTVNFILGLSLIPREL